MEMMLKMFGKDGGAYLRTSTQRGCRDVPMVISMSFYWLCMWFLITRAQDKGDVDRLFYPITYEGVSCGVQSDERDLRDYPALYYPMPTIPELNFCVKECPDGRSPKITDTEAPFSSYICHHDVEIMGRYATGLGPGSNSFTDQTCKPSLLGVAEFFGDDGATCNWLHATCGGGTGASNCDGQGGAVDLACQPSATCQSLARHVAGMGEESGVGGCYHPYGKTTNILFQCIPTELAANATQMLQEMSGNMGSQHFLDMLDFMWVIGVSFGIALGLSFIWIIFLDYFAGPLIWLTVYIVVLMLPACGIMLQYKAGAITAPEQLAVPPEVQARMAEVHVDPVYANYAAYTCYGLALVLSAIFYVFHDRITLSIGVIEEASDCFLSIPKAIILPVFTFVLEVPLLIFAIYSSFTIFSLREHNPETDRYVYSPELKRMLAFNAFGIMWTMYVLVSVQYTTIAGACADWYFTFPDKDGDRDVKVFAVERALYRTLRYNFGSTIFGALLISVVVVVKWVATYFINQVMQQSPENKVIQVLGHCLICLISCIEKFIRFLGKLAYIECAIYGVNFCTGIYSASKRLLKNILRFSFLSVFAHIMIFLGKLGVVAVTVFICNGIIASERDPEKDFDVPYLPLTMCGFAAALTVTLVMSVYETAIDTIMMCFLEDEAENDEKGKPSFATGELAGFMKNTKSISEAADKYNDDVRQAKTNKIRADDDTHDKLNESHAGVKNAR